MKKYVYILFIVFWSSTYLNAQKNEEYFNLELISLRSSFEIFNADSIKVTLKVPFFFSKIPRLDSNVDKLNKVIIEKFNISSFISKNSKIEYHNPFNSELTIDYILYYQDSSFISLLISKHNQSYEIIEDSLKNYFKPHIINSSINYLLDYGLVDMSKVFEKNKLSQFLIDYDLVNSAFDSVFVDFFYMEQDTETLIIRLNSMGNNDSNLNISIVEIITYLKKEHPFTKYLHQVVTPKK